MAENIIVPAYFYPDTTNGYWDRLTAAAHVIGERLIVIANPNNGPGQAVDANYTDAINDVVNNGGRVIGYVFTCYAGRFDPVSPPPSCPRPLGSLDVDSDIEAWYNLYPQIGGIFFDQVSNHPDNLDFYQIRYNNVQLLNPGGLVVFNPGQNTDIRYFEIGNSIQVIFEGTGTDFLAWQPIAARQRRSCALIYNTWDADYRDTLYRVRTHHLLYSYLTDDILHNPWNTLPAYFEQQIEDLAEFC